MAAISRRLVLTSAAALCAIGSAAHASVKYPIKPVTMIVASSPGTGPDVIARIVADRLSQSWGQQVTVMNKVGGFGSVAMQAVTVPPADGHTLVPSSSGSGPNHDPKRPEFNIGDYSRKARA